MGILIDLAARHKKKPLSRKATKSKNQLDLFHCRACDCGCRMELLDIKALLINTIPGIEKQVTGLVKQLSDIRKKL